MGSRGRLLSPLVRGSALYAASVGAERLLTLLLVPVLTRNLAPEMYGAWTQLVVLAALFNQIVSLGLFSAGIRFLGGTADKRYGSSLVHGMLIVGLVNSVLLGLVLLAASNELARWFFGDTAFAGFVQALAAVVAADLLLDLVLVPLRARERTAAVSFYTLIRYTGRLAILAIGVGWLGIDFLHLLFLSSGLQVVLTAWIYRRHLVDTWGISWSYRLVPWRPLLAFGLPAAASSLVVWLNNVADRFLILHLLSLSDVAVYALAGSLASAVTLLASVLVFTLYPAMVSHHNEGRTGEASRLLSRALTIYTALALPAAVGIALLGQPVVRLLATEAYVPPFPVLIWLSLGAVVFGLYSIYTCSLLVLRRTLTHLRATGAAATVNILLNLVLVPAAGIEGAALATLCSNLVLVAAVFWPLRSQARAFAPIPFVAPV